MLDELCRIGKEEKCVFIQLEPNIMQAQSAKLKVQSLAQSYKLRVTSSFHPLFTKYTFIVDLTKSEEELLKTMHPKTRYNIKVAQKHGVEIVEDNSDNAFEKYAELTQETTRRQKFFSHTEKYHRLMWETLKSQKSKVKSQKFDNQLSAHLLLANYRPALPAGRSKTNSQRPTTLVAWILFVFKDTLYYPYGASSSEYRDVMASNLMMWEAIRFGKKLGLKKFDMWGALGPNPDKNDPWYGFHRFKQGYGGELAEFTGSYDLVINPFMYRVVQVADKLRWFFLRFGS